MTSLALIASVVPAYAQGFTVSSDTGFRDQTSQPWPMRGLNAGVQDALQGFSGVIKQYPSLTALRLNVTPGSDKAASIAQVVQQYTAEGIVVMIEDHSGNSNNVAWYQQMAATYRGNPLVFLETPNEPNPSGLADTQIRIIRAIRAAGFSSPVGVQPGGGWDQSNIPAVVAAVGTSQLFVTPHIYYSGSNPNGIPSYVESEVAQAKASGLFASIDEFGNAMDGFTKDPQGDGVILVVADATRQGKAGGLFWAMDNGNHPDGADSAFLRPDGSQLTSVGTALQGWLGKGEHDRQFGTRSAPLEGFSQGVILPQNVAAIDVAPVQRPTTTSHPRTGQARPLPQSTTGLALPGPMKTPIVATKQQADRSAPSTPSQMPAPIVDTDAPSIDVVDPAFEATKQRADALLARSSKAIELARRALGE